MSTVLELWSPEPQRDSVVEPLLLAAPRDVALMLLSAGEEQGSGAAAGLRRLCDSNSNLSAAWSKIKAVCKHCRFFRYWVFPQTPGKEKAIARTNKCESMSSKVSILKWRSGLGQKTSMRRQDDTVNADKNFFPLTSRLNLPVSHRLRQWQKLLGQRW